MQKNFIFTIITCGLVAINTLSAMNFTNQQMFSCETENQPSRNCESESKQPRWLLSLDGGGVRGLGHLHALAAIEKRTGKSIVDLFDGISGSSIGGALACVLTLPGKDGRPKYAPKDLLGMMSERLPRMFNSNWLSFGGLFGERYKSTSAEQVIDELVGDNNFHNRLMPTAIVTCRLDSYKEHIFSTNHHKKNYFTRDIALATTAAPTYFAARLVSQINGYDPQYYIDGGVCAGNPTFAGVELLQEKYGVSSSDINILSLGTGQEGQVPVNRALIDSGKITWINEINHMFLAAQLSITDNRARFYYGNRYHRFDPLLGAGNVRLDDITRRYQGMLLRASQTMLDENFGKIENILRDIAKAKNFTF